MKQPALGKRISELRKERGLTQEELVDQCNINVRTIQRIEAGDVSPRSYTIKAILEVLGFDYETVFENKYIPRKFDSILGINKNKIYNQLNVSMIFGIVYFIVGFIQIGTEYYRVKENLILLDNSVYILIKLLSIFSFFFFIRGFIITGNIYKNYLLEIIAFIILITNTFFGIYDVFSLLFLNETLQFSVIIRILVFGVLSFLLGIGMIKNYKKLGVLSLITGVLEVFAGLSLMFFLVDIDIDIVIIFPLQLLEIILLFKIISNYKKDS